MSSAERDHRRPSSGSLTAITEQNLGFVRGGQLATVDLKVGQRVTAGQVLATVDDAAAAAPLEEQQAQLDAQRAALTRLINATTVQGATTAPTRPSDPRRAPRTRPRRSSTPTSRHQPGGAAAGLRRGRARRRRGAARRRRRRVRRVRRPAGRARRSPASDLLTGHAGRGRPRRRQGRREQEVKEAARSLEAAVKAAGGVAGSLVAVGAAAGSADSACAQAATAAAGRDAGGPAGGGQPDGPGACPEPPRRGRGGGRLAVENARQGVVTAQNNLDSAPRTGRRCLRSRPRSSGVRTPPRGGAAGRRRHRAPRARGRHRRRGQRGRRGVPDRRLGYHRARAGQRRRDPGYRHDGGPAAGTVSRPGGTQFIVLDNVDPFEVVVPFEEADATRIAPNQRVDVRFDAIPDLTRAGTVVSVSPSAIALSGVISYYVTVALNESDARLRNGLTAQAAVVTEELRDVLVVPGRRPSPGQAEQVTVPGSTVRGSCRQPGVVGDATRRCSPDCRRATRSSSPPPGDAAGNQRTGRPERCPVRQRRPAETDGTEGPAYEQGGGPRPRRARQADRPARAQTLDASGAAGHPGRGTDRRRRVHRELRPRRAQLRLH